MKDVEVLFREALKNIDAGYWKKCVDHIVKEEDEYWQKDGLWFKQNDMVLPIELESSDTENDIDD